jgi:hypothetical protein
MEWMCAYTDSGNLSGICSACSRPTRTFSIPLYRSGNNDHDRGFAFRGARAEPRSAFGLQGLRLSRRSHRSIPVGLVSVVLHKKRSSFMMLILRPINTASEGESIMNNTRNHRLNQVSTSTLIIGIDIAKNTHYACAVDDRGVELSTSFSIHQSHHGFHQFYLKLQNLKAIHQKDDLLIGFEPTGHYWMNLAAFLTQNDIRFVMVNPLHVNRSKELVITYKRRMIRRMRESLLN